MKIIKMISEHRNDFIAELECEHCARTTKITNGYHDNYYHTRVMPAMLCKQCGKNRAGELMKHIVAVDKERNSKAVWYAHCYDGVPRFFPKGKCTARIDPAKADMVLRHLKTLAPRLAETMHIVEADT